MLEDYCLKHEIEMQIVESQINHFQIYCCLNLAY